MQSLFTTKDSMSLISAAPARPNYIRPETAVTLDGLLRERMARTPDAIAYRHYDEQSATWRELSWRKVVAEAARWQAALKREGLVPGDRVAVMLRNCPEWIIYDQASIGMGLVVVPLYTADRPENVAYIVRDCGAKVLLLENSDQWFALREVREPLQGLVRILCVNPLVEGADDPRLQTVAEWLPDSSEGMFHSQDDGNGLATIIYTSGTTGRPKGVMLSHANILSNAYGALETFPVKEKDVFLSFLPLSHTFERTVGYYLTMMAGATVVFSRSIPQLAEDLLIVRPTVLVSVPRIYERVNGAIRAALDAGPSFRRRLFELAVEIGYRRFEHAQGRGPWRAGQLLWPLLDLLVARKVKSKLGGRLFAAISGGAPLDPEIARTFIGLGITLLQGYGLTETSPIVCCNRIEDNLPASVGKPLSHTAVRLGEQDALLVKGPGVMLGYWNNPQATEAVMTPDGWLNSGDTARLDSDGRVFITGRLKDIIVLSNGEKVPPFDMESAIMQDPLFDQVMVMGEGRPYLSVMAVINRNVWEKAATEHGVVDSWPQVLQGAQAEGIVLDRIARQIRQFPGYAQVRRACLLDEPWTIENGMLTPTLKLKRTRVIEQYHREYERLYEGHG